jgi:hypothetical protein
MHLALVGDYARCLGEVRQRGHVMARIMINHLDTITRCVPNTRRLFGSKAP